MHLPVLRPVWDAEAFRCKNGTSGSFQILSLLRLEGSCYLSELVPWIPNQILEETSNFIQTERQISKEDVDPLFWLQGLFWEDEEGSLPEEGASQGGEAK
ncbi:hypothetical protein CB1_000667016 [Camelus ferus]|nr:hypothetical protein CB1_000667016 [Camelus ferus]